MVRETGPRSPAESANPARILVEVYVAVEVWNPEKHLPLVHEWTRLRGLGEDAGDVSRLPPTGFVVDGIVAGFLFVVDGCTAGFVDAFVSDPRTTKDARGVAIADLLSAIKQLARERGLRTLSGAICVPKLAERFAGCSFTVFSNFHYFYGRL